MRRGLFVDYLDIVGPFNPSTAPPESYKRIFICSQTTPQCARTILSSLMERAYRRPVTERGAGVQAAIWSRSRSAKAIRSRKASGWRFRRFSRRPISCSASRRIRSAQARAAARTARYRERAPRIR